jgi:hypothetical protein
MATRLEKTPEDGTGRHGQINLVRHPFRLAAGGS